MCTNYTRNILAQHVRTILYNAVSNMLWIILPTLLIPLIASVHTVVTKMLSISADSLRRKPVCLHVNTGKCPENIPDLPKQI